MSDQIETHEIRSGLCPESLWKLPDLDRKVKNHGALEPKNSNADRGKMPKIDSSGLFFEIKIVTDIDN